MTTRPDKNTWCINHDNLGLFTKPCKCPPKKPPIAKYIKPSMTDEELRKVKMPKDNKIFMTNRTTDIRIKKKKKSNKSLLKSYTIEPPSNKMSR